MPDAPTIHSRRITRQMDHYILALKSNLAADRPSFLLSLYWFYGNDLTVECPTGSGVQMNLFEVAEEISRRLTSIFVRGADGRRPIFGGTTKFQDDPHWRDLILFYEYFHGDNGAGLGASHQTGWTGLIARLMDTFGRLDEQAALDGAIGRSIVGDLAQQAASGRQPAR